MQFKHVLAVFLFPLLLNACSSASPYASMSFEEQKVVAAQLQLEASENYEHSQIPLGEVVRLAINNSFLAAWPAYEDYMLLAENSPDVKNFLAYTQEMSKKEREKVYQALDAPSREKIDHHLRSSSFRNKLERFSLALEGFDKALTLYEQRAPSTKSLITLNSEGFNYEQLLKEVKLYQMTAKQFRYLKDVVKTAYQTASQLSALANAE